jgi:hypothetical protein
LRSVRRGRACRSRFRNLCGEDHQSKSRHPVANPITDVTSQTFGCAVNRTSGTSSSQLMLINHFLDTVSPSRLPSSPRMIRIPHPMSHVPCLMSRIAYRALRSLTRLASPSRTPSAARSSGSPTRPRSTRPTLLPGMALLDSTSITASRSGGESAVTMISILDSRFSILELSFRFDVLLDFPPLHT